MLKAHVRVGVGHRSAIEAHSELIAGRGTQPAGAALAAGWAAADFELGTVADTSGAVAINFLEYKDAGKPLEVMMLSGTFGLKSYDVSVPSSPVLLDEIPAADFRLPSDPLTYNRAFWQNEDMDVDQARKLVIMARDPRAFDGSTSSPASIAGVYIVDAADPTNLELKTFEELPVGHTSAQNRSPASPATASNRVS